MPQVLALKPNDKPETIFSPRDFEELIDKHMGFDSVRGSTAVKLNSSRSVFETYPITLTIRTFPRR